MTDEERSWEQYDLNKLFKFTTYTKIYNHLKGKIARIDAALDTNFLAELKFLVDKEKAEWDATKADETKVEMGLPTEKEMTFNETDTIPTSQPEVMPTRTRQPVTESAPTTFGVTQLGAYSKLTEVEKAEIESVNFDGALPKIIFRGSPTVLACPECGVPSPETFSTCPHCGVSF